MSDDQGAGGHGSDAPNWRKSSGRVRGISIRSLIWAICLSSPPTEAYASFSSPGWTVTPESYVALGANQRHMR